MCLKATASAADPNCLKAAAAAADPRCLKATASAPVVPARRSWRAWRAQLAQLTQPAGTGTWQPASWAC